MYSSSYKTYSNVEEEKDDFVADEFIVDVTWKKKCIFSIIIIRTRKCSSYTNMYSQPNDELKTMNIKINDSLNILNS